MRKSGRKLKTGLYGIPILLVFAMAIIIYIVFYLAVNSYVARLAERNIEMRFDVLDAYYHSSAYEGYYDDGSDFIITVRHMIFDDAGRLLSPAVLDGDAEKAQTKEIAARYAGGDLSLRDGQGKKLRLDNNAYYLMQRTYVGVFDGAFVVERAGGRTYSVLAYIDITPIADFLRLLTHVLLILIAGFSSMTAALLLLTGKRLDRSFQSLKEYILHVGERKEVSRAKTMPYAEFNEITDTVFQMSGMIEAAEAAQVKFFQNASHELRTPLTAIRGYAEGLSSGVIRDVKASASIIMEHSDKMSALVDELLYTSKLDAHMEVEGNETFDLRETVGHSLWELKEKFERADLRLDLQFPDEKVLILGSEKLLERAVSNILSNATRYAKTEIAVSLAATAGQAILTVTDDGDGISPEDLPHIFERFYKGRGGVSGLGLSITQEAVRRHGGTVTAASAEGHTVFTVSLPVQSA